jgi:hypothetical protein
MADRPPIAIATIKDNKVVRFEFYQGHDSLAKEFDLRSEELQKANLKDSYGE